LEAVQVGGRLTYKQRIERLRRSKLEQTAEKQRIIGSMDYDDWAIVLPPPDRRDVRQLVGPSGAPITDVLLKGYQPEANHPSGGFFGPRIVGKNFRRLLEVHPTYVDPMSSLAGAYMTNFFSYRQPHWNPDLEPAELRENEKRYQLAMGIGGVQHFCQDLSIGLKLGWGGILDKIRRYRQANGPDAQALYDGLEDVVLGMQNWIGRHAERAAQLSAGETEETLRADLLAMAEINRRLVSEAPRTFRQACQWILWYQMAARMYNGSGSLGALDQLLIDYYRRDREAGILDQEEAVFHIACLLLRDTSYLQVGGYDRQGRDNTNELSYLVLEAVEALKVPANVGVCVGRGIDPRLLMKGVEMQFRHKNGIPKFLGVDNTARGFARNGYPLELAWNRIYSGCHWSAIPGREYTMNDIIKVNLAAVFDVAFHDLLSDAGTAPSVAALWTRFERHLRAAVATIAAAVDFHLRHMRDVFPELVLDLLCHGPIEQGRDATDHGLEYYDIGVDAAGLAIAADSFAALEQRIERENRLSWSEILRHMNSNWRGPDGERIRLLMKTVPRYGSGDSLADEYAVRISRLFTDLVKEKPTPAGFNLIPGLFSWALALSMGKNLGATPDGRRAGDPISHGANPVSGFRKDGAPTAMAVAIAAVQPGYGQTAPMQLDLDPGLGREEGGLEKVAALINGHFDLGGTQVNLNIMDARQVLEAYKDPSRHPELVVRVTGFSAYFASLSPELRKFVVDRMIREEA
jgi:formate C-acetyltransferase